MPLFRVGIFFRGLLMCIAEIISGISGVTIAFISGIYSELVAALASFGSSSLKLLRSPKDFFEHHNMSFLLKLVMGMLCGVLVFSHFLSCFLYGF